MSGKNVATARLCHPYNFGNYVATARLKANMSFLARLVSDNSRSFKKNLSFGHCPTQPPQRTHFARSFSSFSWLPDRLIWLS